ncbi:MAG TPA: GrpB family protein [Tepidiformaceae bacterium]|nr:GrpB family protein [Tepidiformaceae bacterium]
MPKRIHVDKWDARWSDQFEHEAGRILAACPPGIVAIEHVGSTSVPGLAAKPVIDMVILVEDYDAGEQFVEAIRSLGYVYKAVNGIPGRRYFDLASETPGELDRFHIHMYPVGHDDARRVLAFRDFLRANPAAVEQYARGKLELAAKYPEDILLYTGGKSAIIRALYRAMDGRAADPIEVTPYDASWSSAFEAAAAGIRAGVPAGLLGIEHIGSTAVPGLAAKPVIDIMPVVDDFDAARPLVMQFKELGYWYCGENGIPRRHYFVREDASGHVVEHVHVLEDSSVEARKHRMFRDYLRTSKSARERYGNLKLELASRHRNDRLAYTEAKTSLVAELLREAGWQGSVPSA